jgi:hypothetical protein
MVEPYMAILVEAAISMAGTTSMVAASSTGEALRMVVGAGRYHP